MRNIFNLLIPACCLLSLVKKDNPIHSKDFKVLENINWTGTLTYLDYSSNKNHTIPASIIVSQDTKDKNTFYFKYSYPKEPQENSIYTMVVSKTGSYLNKEMVVERSKTNTEGIKIITQKNDNDDGIEKTFRYTYILSSSRFSIKKEERKTKDRLWTERNIYTFVPS